MTKHIFDKFNPNNIQVEKINESIYEMICLQFGKVVNKYFINQELHSDIWWKLLKEQFKVNDSMIWTETETNIDEKGKEHKYYKYIIRLNKEDLPMVEEECDADTPVIFFVFYDEFRNLDDTDYLSDTTEEEKTDKISNLTIFYDSTLLPTKKLEEITLDKLKEEKVLHISNNKNKFFTIGVDSYGYKLNPATSREMEIDLSLNYGEKFVEIDKSIVDKLKNEYHGLFLLHGAPGTGKTTYIRKLISELSEHKTFIYIPSYMMETMAEPSFISFLSEFKESILLLEDSESIITTEFSERTQAVSNILNICDGLLGDDMKIQIISTFNMKKGKIDEALQRAGRLMVDYEFNLLDPADANKLAKHHGIEKTFTQPASLAEVYQGHNQIQNTLEDSFVGFDD